MSTPESRPPWQPLANFTAAMPEISGNTVNGLGETEFRRPSPFFWHPPERQTHGALQTEVIRFHRQSPEMREHFNPRPPGGRGPAPVERAAAQAQGSPESFARAVRDFVLAHEGDDVRIAAMKPEYVFEGYALDDPWVILIAVAMPYEEIAQAPATFENPTAGVVVAREYNRASRACRELANFILGLGYSATPWPGPFASALSMMPAAIDCGLGELGKHGSLIHPRLGSSFRLSAVTTDLPLAADPREDFGSHDFCVNCRICVDACPPQAISHDEQMVRGVRKWYVDFDRCIPYFGETLGCGICLAVCPWSRPGVAPRLAEKMTRRQGGLRREAENRSA